VADIEIPTDLIQLKRRFYELDKLQSDVAARMPSSMAIAGGEAEISEADREEYDALGAEQQQLVLAIHRHPALEGLSQKERYELQEAASAAERAAL